MKSTNLIYVSTFFLLSASFLSASNKDHKASNLAVALLKAKTTKQAQPNDLKTIVSNILSEPSLATSPIPFNSYQTDFIYSRPVYSGSIPQDMSPIAKKIMEFDRSEFDTSKSDRSESDTSESDTSELNESEDTLQFHMDE